MIVAGPGERTETPKIERPRFVHERYIERTRVPGGKRQRRWCDCYLYAGRRGDRGDERLTFVADIGDAPADRSRIGEPRYADRWLVQVFRVERETGGLEFVTARVRYGWRLRAASEGIVLVVTDVVDQPRIQGIVRHDMPRAELKGCCNAHTIRLHEVLSRCRHHGRLDCRRTPVGPGLHE